MRVFRHTSATGAERGAVVAVGNFDGVHLGHQAVIAAAKAAAAQAGARLAVLTFEPHPRSVFQPGAPPFRLTPFRAKARALEALGVDYLFTLHFDLDFAKKSAETFVEAILVEGLGVKAVVVGYDFVFGNKRRGTPELLRADPEEPCTLPHQPRHRAHGGRRVRDRPRAPRCVAGGRRALQG